MAAGKSSVRATNCRKNSSFSNKNRKLEIEAALEQIRAQANAMHAPEDMTKVALTVWEQLGKPGPVVAGVIGKKKFSYDLWGDTVNTAARMEAYGYASCIQVAPPSYAILMQDYAFKKIPDVEIKGKGKMDVYLWRA